MKKMQRIVALLLLVCLICTSAFAMASSTWDKKKALPAVRIIAHGTLPADFVFTDSNGSKWVPYDTDSISTSLGSGFAVGEKGKDVQYFVTNKHVVVGGEGDGSYTFILENTSTGDLAKFEATVPASGIVAYVVYDNVSNMIRGKVADISTRADLAVIQIEDPTDVRPAAVLRLYDDIDVETIYPVGFPSVADFTLDEMTKQEFRGTIDHANITSGKINKLVKDFNTNDGEHLVIDATINSGNSGGPVFDEQGRVVGVATSSITNAQNTNHAVTSNEVHRLLEDNHIKHSTVKSGSDSALPYIIAGVVILLAVAAVVLNKLSGTTGKNRRYLVGNNGALSGKQFTLRGEMVIGTNSNACQIVFPKGTPGVSGRHCTIKIDKGVVTVIDIGSTYGTWIDDTKLQAGQPMVLHRGHTLKLGSPDQTFKLIS